MMVLAKNIRNRCPDPFLDYKLGFSDYIAKSLYGYLCFFDILSFWPWYKAYIVNVKAKSAFKIAPYRNADAVPTSACNFPAIIDPVDRPIPL